MLTDTSVLIDEVIERLETLSEVFADDVTVCRRAGLTSDERKCAAALDGIATLLPRLQSARSTQEPAHGLARHCPNCD
jgi:hypothetical protein